MRRQSRAVERLGAAAVSVLLVACAAPNATPSPAPSRTDTEVPGLTESTTESTPPLVACRTADLRIAVTNTEAAAGNVGGYLLFENTTAATCTLHGAPSLTAATASGATTQARVSQTTGTPFPSLSQPPLVILRPGDRAFAAYGGTDNAGTPSATCPPPYHTFHVAPPGDPAGVEIPAFNTWLGQDQPSCAGLEVTVIAPASLVRQYDDLGSLRP